MHASSGNWAITAAYNLSEFRSTMFLRIQQFLQTWHNDEHPWEGHQYDPFYMAVTCPPTKPLRRIGKGGDGGKIVCGVTEPGSEEPCTVISLGSNNNVIFEQGVLDDTPCNVVTFDCTVKEPVILKGGKRHKFFKYCVGSPDDTARSPDTFKTYAQLLEAAGIKSTPLLKIDVEGYEYPTFAYWKEDTPGLPDQIAVEIHTRMPGTELSRKGPRWNRPEYGVTDLALFFMHMANLGYAPISREDNGKGRCCSEFSFIRVEVLPAFRLRHAERLQSGTKSEGVR